MCVCISFCAKTEKTVDQKFDVTWSEYVFYGKPYKLFNFDYIWPWPLTLKATVVFQTANPVWYQLVSGVIRWVTPGVATEGVTPLFFPEKPGDLFLVITVSASSAVSPLFIFFWITDDLFAQQTLRLGLATRRFVLSLSTFQYLSSRTDNTNNAVILLCVRWRRRRHAVTNTEVSARISLLRTSAIELKLLTQFAEWSSFLVDCVIR